MSVPRVDFLLVAVLGGCAALPPVDSPPVVIPATPVPVAVSSTAKPSSPSEPPATFAVPPRLSEDTDSIIAPSDLPVPGYHCHWLGPGKRYCHGGTD